MNDKRACDALEALPGELIPKECRAGIALVSPELQPSMNIPEVLRTKAAELGGSTLHPKRNGHGTSVAWLFPERPPAEQMSAFAIAQGFAPSGVKATYRKTTTRAWLVTAVIG